LALLSSLSLSLSFSLFHFHIPSVEQHLAHRRYSINIFGSEYSG
jgi:hypothetical protein